MKTANKFQVSIDVDEYLDQNDTERLIDQQQKAISALVEKVLRWVSVSGNMAAAESVAEDLDKIYSYKSKVENGTPLTRQEAEQLNDFNSQYSV